MTYRIVYPGTPGATPTTSEPMTLRQARAAALEVRTRKDLTYQDVRIVRRGGDLYEYAGPAR